MRVTVNLTAIDRAGRRILTLIVERSLAGKDKDGQPFPAYSRNTFALPAAAVPKRARAILVKEGRIHYFQRKRILFIAVIGGYISLKGAVFAQTGYNPTSVNLLASGAMWRSLAVLSVSGQLIVIGFTRVEEARKAMYNIARGRDFLGLSQEDSQDEQLRKILADGLEIQF